MWKLTKKSFQGLFLSIIICSLFALCARAEETLILEPIVQDILIDAPILSIEKNGVYYFRIEDFAATTGIKLEKKGTVYEGYLSDEENTFSFDTNEVDKNDTLLSENNLYFSQGFFEKTFPVKLETDPYAMQIIISSPKDLPIKVNNDKNQRRGTLQEANLDTFKNYHFDNRYFSSPVVDLTYSKGFNKNHGTSSFDTDYYQIDSSMLLFGLDTSVTIFDDNEPFHKNSTRYRFLSERTFLDEPTNMLNLKQFKMGDISSFQSTLVDNAAYGRGMYFSSFKDLVMSADKTIEISGPLSAGWEVELYVNEQLIGYRQNSISGRYDFENIAVSYGLNIFKLVFYGPYGEIRTEEKRYYSGTSPVKKGELGYNINLYEKNRFLVETNENLPNKNDKESFDATFYYGFDDNITVIGGQSQTVDVYNNNEVKSFSNIGLQSVLSGASVQYNTIYSNDNHEFGHHFDVQGNVYIGDIFARYEYYGKLETPISYYNGVYLKDLIEARLSGLLYEFNVPYFVSYKVMRSHEEETFREIRTRLSPNFWRYYNFTIENVWQKSQYNRFNYTDAIFNAQFDKLGISAHAQYYTYPQSQLNNFGGKIDYRLDKNTYVQFEWTHYNQLKNKKNEYYLDEFSYTSSESSFDVFTLSGGRLFDFGGLTLSLAADTHDNYSAYLTYNVSIGKVPDKIDFFTNSQTKMTDYGTVHVKVYDENNIPIEKAKIWVTGTEKPVFTDEFGEALITDIQPYEKSSLSLSLEEIDDISLYSDQDTYKMVFRPGTILPLDIKLTHRGGIEGQIEIAGADEKFDITLSQKDFETHTTTDTEGFFIFDDIKYGTYEMKIYDKDKNLVKENNIIIDTPLTTIEEVIKCEKKGLEQQTL